jgi:hypothetical protein
LLNFSYFFQFCCSILIKYLGLILIIIFIFYIFRLNPCKFELNILPLRRCEFCAKLIYSNLLEEIEKINWFVAYMLFIYRLNFFRWSPV